MSAYKNDKRDEGVAVRAMDIQGESVNTIRPDFGTDFAEVFEHLDKDSDVKAVVFTSAKKDFIVGADIKMLDTPSLNMSSGSKNAGKGIFARRSRRLLDSRSKLGLASERKRPPLGRPAFFSSRLGRVEQTRSLERVLRF